MAAVKWLVIHHSGAGPGRPTALAVAQYQTGPTAHLDFPAMAYHFYCEADGTIEQVHDLETLTWSQGDGSPYSVNGVGIFNYWGIAACFSGDEPTEQQISALKALGTAVDVLMDRSLQRLGHKDVSKSPDGTPLTECPGAGWATWRTRIEIH